MLRDDNEKENNDGGLLSGLFRSRSQPAARRHRGDFRFNTISALTVVLFFGAGAALQLLAGGLAGHEELALIAAAVLATAPLRGPVLGRCNRSARRHLGDADPARRVEPLHSGRGNKRRLTHSARHRSCKRMGQDRRTAIGAIPSRAGTGPAAADPAPGHDCRIRGHANPGHGFLGRAESDARYGTGTRGCARVLDGLGP